MSDAGKLTAEQKESIQQALGLRCDSSCIGKGGESRVFRSTDTVMRGGKNYAVKLFNRRRRWGFGSCDPRKSLEHIEMTFAQLGRISQEFDPGTVHLVYPLLFFDLDSPVPAPLPPPGQQAQSDESTSSQAQSQTRSDDPADDLAIELLESSRRPGFVFRVIGIDEENKEQLKEALNEANLQGIRPETAIKVHFPREDPENGFCRNEFFMAVVTELYDGSLYGVLRSMEDQSDGKPIENPKLEAAAADVKNWPWKVKLQSLCGVLMMRQATKDGHGDFKPQNILFRMCHNTVWWTCLFSSFFLSFVCDFFFCFHLLLFFVNSE